MAGCREQINVVIYLFIFAMNSTIFGQEIVHSNLKRTSRFVTQYTYYDDKVREDLIKTRTDSAGRTTSYTYNEHRQLTMITYADSTKVEYSYDKFGRQTAMKDWTGVTTYEYDTLNRLIQIKQSNGLWAKFEYDSANKVTAIITPYVSPEKEQVWRVEYVYDFLGHLSQINSPVGQFIWQNNYAKGTVVRRMPNGIVTTFSFRPDGMLASIRHEREKPGEATNDKRRDANPTLLAEFSYSYYPDGKISSESMITSKNKRQISYGYDKAGRLAGVILPEGEEITYSYDIMGNRLTRNGPSSTVKCGYDKWDQIQYVDKETFGHDKLGNVAWRKDKNRQISYSYDYQNHLIKVSSPRGSVHYKYNGDGFLIGRNIGKTATNYLLMPFGRENRILAEFGKNPTTKHYVLSDRTLCVVSDDGPKFYLEDRLGSVRLVTDAKGKVTCTVSYEPFGTPDSLPKSGTPTLSFAGLPYDPLAYVYLTKARSYDATLGRFLQVDPYRRLPYGAYAGLLFYAYCDNDPINFVDKNGLERDWVQTNFRDQHLFKSQESLFAPDPLNPLNKPIGYRPQDYGDPFYDRVRTLNEISSRIPVPSNEQLEQNDRYWESGQYLSDDPYYSNLARELDNAPDLLFPLHVVRASAATAIYSFGAYSKTVGSFVPIPGLGTALSHTGDKLMTEVRAEVRSGLPDDIAYPLVNKMEKVQNNLNKMTTFIDITKCTRAFMDVALSDSSIPKFVVNQAKSTALEHVTKFSINQISSPTQDYITGETKDALVGLPSQEVGLAFLPTRVGGVRLDKEAKMLGDIGQISVLTYEPKTKQLILVGEEKQTSLPAVRLDDLAVIMRSIYIEGVDPYVSIDPKKGDLYGSKMDVVYSPGLANTHAGKVMIEADYKLKEYAAGGRKNKKLISKVSNWKSVSRIEHEKFPSGRKQGEDIWYRFWLKPADITLKLSPDGKNVVFDHAKVMVETENMIMKKGRLERVENVKDPTAESFAEMFTDSYDEFANESAVYEELQKLAQIVGLVKWMYQQGIEIDLRWVMRHSQPICKTPLEVDSVWAEQLHEQVGPKGLEMRILRYFGGVNLSASFIQGTWGKRQTTEYQNILEQVRADPIVESWSNSSAKKTQYAAVLPGCIRQMLGAFQTNSNDLSVKKNEFSLNFSRNYNSHFNEPTEFGHSWSLSLPRIYTRKRLLSETQFPGNSNVPVVILSNDMGAFEHRFVNLLHNSPNRFAGPQNSGIVELQILPNNKGYRVVFYSGTKWVFDEKGYIKEQVLADKHIVYEYKSPVNLPRQMTTITLVLNGTKTGNIRLNCDYDVYGRICAVSGSDGRKVSYTYDKAGNLGEVNSGDHKLLYGYDENHQLISISKDGQMIQMMQYDDAGQMTELSFSDNSKRQFTYAKQEDGGSIIIEESTSTKLEYDKQLHLHRLSQPGKETLYGYYRNGSIRNIRQINAEGLRTDIKLSENQRSCNVALPSGATHSYKKDTAGRITNYSVNGEEIIRIQYDQIRRHISELVFPKMRVKRLFKGKELVREFLEPTNSGSFKNRLEIGYQSGRMTFVKKPGGLLAQFKYSDDNVLEEVITPRGTTKITRNEQNRRISISSDFGRELIVTCGQDGIIETVIKKVEDSLSQCDYTEGRLKKIQNFDGGVIEYGWNNGSLAYVVDALGERTEYTYCKVVDENFLENVKLPNGRQISFKYDRHGRISQVEE